jgi:hypothetical protein
MSMLPAFDAASDVRLTADGYLLAQPRVAKAGVEICDYPERNLYGLRVFRSASELFRPATLALLAGKVVTMDHPPEPVTGGAPV